MLEVFVCEQLVMSTILVKKNKTNQNASELIPKTGIYQTGAKRLSLVNKTELKRRDQKLFGLFVKNLKNSRQIVREQCPLMILTHSNENKEPGLTFLGNHIQEPYMVP